MDSRVRYHFRHGRPYKYPLIQDNPRLGQLGKHIDDKFRRRAYIIKTFDINARKLKNILPHMHAQKKTAHQKVSSVPSFPSPGPELIDTTADGLPPPLFRL